jgi:lipopolysaccharide heptosyltransferase I
VTQPGAAGPAWLIVRLGALGDIVHTLPLAAALRAWRPEARIDWLVDVRHRRILDYVAGLSSVIAVDTRRLRGATGLIAVVRRLRAAGYDLAIDAQGLLKSAALARLAGARRVLGFDRASLREPLARWAYDAAAAPRGPHVVDRALALAAAAGAPDAPPVFSLRPPAADIVSRVRAILEIDAAQPFAVLNPGAAWPNKRWPADRFGALAQEIERRHGWRSIVAYGPGEHPLAVSVVTAADGSAADGSGRRAAELAPSSGLGDLLALLSGASLVVSGDTGPLHLAAALGRPVVGLYGPTDPARNGSWSPRDVTVSRAAHCRCSHQRRCHAARWCLADVSVREVADAVDRRLHGGAAEEAVR